VYCILTLSCSIFCLRLLIVTLAEHTLCCRALISSHCTDTSEPNRHVDVMQYSIRISSCKLQKTKIVNGHIYLLMTFVCQVSDVFLQGGILFYRLYKLSEKHSTSKLL